MTRILMFVGLCVVLFCTGCTSHKEEKEEGVKFQLTSPWKKDTIVSREYVCQIGNGVREMIPGFKVSAVDATGAGDVFNGALAVALSEGRPLLEAARFGSAAAAISVTRFGAQPSAPTRRDIQTVLATGKVRPRV